MLLYDHKEVMVSPNGGQGLHSPPHYDNLPYDHEVQSQQKGNIGKPCSLSNVVSGEDHGQIVQNPSSSSSSSSPSPPGASYFLGNINLNGRFSKKTIDEVWKEIVHHEADNNNYNNKNQSVVVQQQLQFTLGETTLEDFLLRAGVITNNMNTNNNDQDSVANYDQQFMGIDPMDVVPQQADWLQFQMAATAHQQQQQMGVMDTGFIMSESSVYENPVGDIGYSENHQLALTMPVPANAAPSESKVNSNVEKKRRYSDEIMEKTIERKQKRMIKNRESAARSRARKQAYTNQLESQVVWLKKTNSWLKKQKEVEILLSSYPTTMSKHQLRRASSV